MSERYDEYNQTHNKIKLTKASKITAGVAAAALIGTLGAGIAEYNASHTNNVSPGHVAFHSHGEPGNISVIVRPYDNPSTIAGNYAHDFQHRQHLTGDIVRQEINGNLLPGQQINLPDKDVDQIPTPGEHTTLSQ